MDAIFESEGLPRLNSIQQLFSKKVRAILRAGTVKSEADYYALKALEDADLAESTKEEIWKLIGDYETRAA